MLHLPNDDERRDCAEREQEVPQPFDTPKEDREPEDHREIVKGPERFELAGAVTKWVLSNTSPKGNNDEP